MRNVKPASRIYGAKIYYKHYPSNIITLLKKTKYVAYFHNNSSIIRYCKCVFKMVNSKYALSVGWRYFYHKWKMSKMKNIISKIYRNSVSSIDSWEKFIKKTTFFINLTQEIQLFRKACRVLMMNLIKAPIMSRFLKFFRLLSAFTRISFYT